MNVLKIQTDILKGLIKGGEPIYTTEKDGMVGMIFTILIGGEEK